MAVSVFCPAADNAALNILIRLESCHSKIRPDNIPADEGKYFTDNEFIIMICAGWAALLIIPVLITSYLTKRWIVDNKNALKN